MTTMLEKMATAIAETGYVSEQALRMGAAEAIARDALLAIREPSETMIDAAFSDTTWDEANNHTDPIPAFTAMIDAILNEKPERTG